jgi:hypothetical protein
MDKKKRFLELRKESNRFNKSIKLLQETFLRRDELKIMDFSRVLTSAFILTKSEENFEESLEEEESYII